MATPPTEAEYAHLAAVARELRKEVVRMVHAAGGGDLGDSLSAVEILTALIFRELRLDPSNPAAPERDRLLLSKGHAAAALYAALAHRGYFPTEELLTFRRAGGRLQGRADRLKLPGIEASTGSLGQGVGMAVGLALDQRLRGRSNRVVVVLGDAEGRAGLAYEALLAGAQLELDHLTVVVDRSETLKGEPGRADPLEARLRGFGYATQLVDGHDLPALCRAFDAAKQTTGRPSAIVARTVLGKGVSFLEREAERGGRAPDREETERALHELGGAA
jgi:transketolase